MKFSEEEIRDMVYGDFDGDVVETIEGENRRWTRSNITYVQIDNKFYELVWEQGLTENQEDDFWEQDAPEVERVITSRTVYSWEWKPVK